jgi:hypothetical protein
MFTLTVLIHAESLDWSYQRLVPRWHWTNYGRDKIWLAGCLGLESRLVESQLEVSDFCTAPRWGRRGLEREVQAVPWIWIIYLGICLTTEENTENFSHVIRKAPGWPAPYAIRLVDMAIAGDGLDWPPGPIHPSFTRQATGSTLGELSICAIDVIVRSPHHLTLN